MSGVVGSVSIINLEKNWYPSISCHTEVIQKLTQIRPMILAVTMVQLDGPRVLIFILAINFDGGGIVMNGLHGNIKFLHDLEYDGAYD